MVSRIHHLFPSFASCPHWSSPCNMNRLLLLRLSQIFANPHRCCLSIIRRRLPGHLKRHSHPRPLAVVIPKLWLTRTRTYCRYTGEVTCRSLATMTISRARPNKHVNKLNPLRFTHLQKRDDQVCGMSRSPQTTHGPLISRGLRELLQRHLPAHSVQTCSVPFVHTTHSLIHWRDLLVPFAFNVHTTWTTHRPF